MASRSFGILFAYVSFSLFRKCIYFICGNTVCYFAMRLHWMTDPCVCGSHVLLCLLIFLSVDSSVCELWLHSFVPLSTFALCLHPHPSPQELISSWCCPWGNVLLVLGLLSLVIILWTVNLASANSLHDHFQNLCFSPVPVISVFMFSYFLTLLLA